MRKHVLWLVLLVGGAVVANVPGEDGKQQDFERLQGTWMVVQAEMNGKRASEEEAKRHKIVITKDKKLTIHTPQGSKTATFEIDPESRPRSIDLVPEDGKDKGRTLPGIYALEGDTLKLCFQEKGKERPKDFMTKADSGLVLFVVRKAKQ